MKHSIHTLILDQGDILGGAERYAIDIMNGLSGADRRMFKNRCCWAVLMQNIKRC